MKKAYRFLFISAIFIALFAYNNCSKGGFEVSQSSSSSKNIFKADHYIYQNGEVYQQKISFKNINGLAVMGDITLGSTKEILRTGFHQIVPVRDGDTGELRIDPKDQLRLMRFAGVVQSSQFVWPGGIVPYTFNKPTERPPLYSEESWSGSESLREFGSREREWFNAVIEELENEVKVGEEKVIDFVDITGNEDAYPNHVFVLHWKDNCNSFVGNRGSGPQHLLVDIDYCGAFTAKHEALHTLGFWHEQIHRDRDNHITVLSENILEDAEDNFKLKPNGANVQYGDFDPLSVMLYHSWGFGKSHNHGGDWPEPTIVLEYGKHEATMNILSEQLQYCYHPDDDRHNGDWRNRYICYRVGHRKVGDKWQSYSHLSAGDVQSIKNLYAVAVAERTCEASLEPKNEDVCSIENGRGHWLGRSCGEDGDWTGGQCSVVRCNLGYKIDDVNNRCVEVQNPPPLPPDDPSPQTCPATLPQANFQSCQSQSSSASNVSVGASYTRGNMTPGYYGKITLVCKESTGGSPQWKVEESQSGCQPLPRFFQQESTERVLKHFPTNNSFCWVTTLEHYQQLAGEIDFRNLTVVPADARTPGLSTTAPPICPMEDLSIYEFNPSGIQLIHVHQGIQGQVSSDHNNLSSGWVDFSTLTTTGGWEFKKIGGVGGLHYNGNPYSTCSDFSIPAGKKVYFQWRFSYDDQDQSKWITGTVNCP